MTRTNIFILVFIIAIFFSASVHASYWWAPAHRYGPEILSVVTEPWDGYESYDGYFWMYHGLMWTDKEIAAFRSMQQGAGRVLTGAYEFRRVDENNEEGSSTNDHWDGAWGRDECFGFLFCIAIQRVYTEYVSSLPSSHNKGLEEFDSWFSSGHGLSLLGPPSRYYDWCDVVEKYGAGSGCDEEYEVGFNPNELIPNRYYYVAIKFRTDTQDGAETTKWQAEFEAHKEERNPLIPYYTNINFCKTDSGYWSVKSSERSWVESGVNNLYNCTDYDKDGFADNADNCPYHANSGQEDKDGDGIGDACDDNRLIHIDDIDADGIVHDNCPQVSNPDQANFDNDDYGDVCDDDDDNDGYIDSEDAFPLNPAEWIDTDNDGVGNEADTDDDGDGYSDADEISKNTDPLNKYSFPIDNGGSDPGSSDSDNDGYIDSEDAFPNDGSEWVDTDGDGLGNNKDTDDDNDCYVDTVETGSGTDPLNPSSVPLDTDHDCNPNVFDDDDDGDQVADASDAFPLDSSEWLDTDGDGLGNNSDADDDGDGMPDLWEIAYQMNPLDPSDANLDKDQDGSNNLAEFMNGTDPLDSCSPPQILFCYNFYGDDDLGQCGGSTGVQCVPLNEWTPWMLINTDSRMGGCWQSFSLWSSCTTDVMICLDFQGDSGTADMTQCGNRGQHCAGLNEWTSPIRMDMDGRNGWCTEQFFVRGMDDYTLVLDFMGEDGDSSGQCKNVGMSKSFSEYGSGTDLIGLDTDDRPGGCWQRMMLMRGTWSMMAF